MTLPLRTLADPCGPVGDEWLGLGEWLSDAPVAFGVPAHVQLRQAAAERFVALGDGETAESFASRSAHGADDPAARLPPEQRAAWHLFLGLHRALQVAIKFQLQDQRLVAFGSPGESWNAPEWIPAGRWDHLAIDPRGSVARGAAGVFVQVRVMTAEMATAVGSVTAAVPSIPTTQATAAPRTPADPLPPYNAYAARALLISMKAGKQYPHRPTESKVNEIILGNFSTTSRDGLRKIIKEVWKDEVTRGPRPAKPAKQRGCNPQKT